MIRVCLIRKSWKMCSVGVPPGTGLGNSALSYGEFDVTHSKKFQRWLPSEMTCLKGALTTLFLHQR